MRVGSGLVKHIAGDVLIEDMASLGVGQSALNEAKITSSLVRAKNSFSSVTFISLFFAAVSGVFTVSLILMKTSLGIFPLVKILMVYFCLATASNFKPVVVKKDSSAS